MQNAKLFAMIVLALSVAGIAYSDATISVSGHSVVPEKLYPGTIGYLQLTLTNSGTDEAQGISVQYGDIGASLPVGDLAAGSSATVSVPFNVASDAYGKIYLVSAKIFYTDTGKTLKDAVTKTSFISIPVEISQIDAISAQVLSVDKSSIAPGDRITYEVLFTNLGGVANSLQVTTPENSSFSIDGNSRLMLGTIGSGKSAAFNISLRSTSSTQTGSFNIPLSITYSDALGKPVGQAVNIGPVNVLSTSMQYRLSSQSPVRAEIGSETAVDIIFQNFGTEPVSAVADVDSTDAFMPIGVQKLYFDAVPSGGSQTQRLILGVSPTKEAGYYSLPIVLTPNRGQPATFNFGILVTATPKVEIGLEDGTAGTLRILVANNGNSAIRSVSLSATEQGKSAVIAKSFIGTLNVDDSSGVDLPSTATFPIEVTVTFKDSTNAEKTITQALQQGSLSSFAFGTSGNRTAQLRTQFAGNRGFGIPFLGGNGSINYPVIIGAIIAVAVAAYLVYWKFFSKKKQ